MVDGFALPSQLPNADEVDKAISIKLFAIYNAIWRRKTLLARFQHILNIVRTREASCSNQLVLQFRNIRTLLPWLLPGCQIRCKGYVIGVCLPVCRWRCFDFVFFLFLLVCRFLLKGGLYSLTRVVLSVDALLFHSSMAHSSEITEWTNPLILAFGNGCSEADQVVSTRKIWGPVGSIWFNHPKSTLKNWK